MCWHNSHKATEQRQQDNMRKIHKIQRIKENTKEKVIKWHLKITT